MKRLLGLSVLVAGALFALPGAASASSCAYTGAALGNWSNTANWDCAEVPDSGDSATIGAGDNVAVTAAQSAGALTISGGGFITLSNQAVLSAASVSAESGTVQGPGTLTVSGAFAKTTSSSFSVKNNGSGESADMTLNGASTFSGGLICIADDGDANPDLPTLNINNTFTINTGVDVNSFACTSGPRIHVNAPNGHLIHAASGTTNVGTMIDNDDTITVQSGELVLLGGTGGETSTGQYIANTGGTLQFGTCCGDQFNLSSTARVGGPGTIDMSANRMDMAAGSTLDPAVLNIIFAELRVDGSSAQSLPVVNITNSATLDIDRPTTITSLNINGSGTLRGTSTVTVPAGGSFTKTGAGQLAIGNSGSAASVDLILNVDATLAGGHVCAARNNDSDPDLPGLHINRNFTIGAGADAVWFPCSANQTVHVNGPSGQLSKSGAGNTTSFGGIDVAGGTLTVGAGQTFNFSNALLQSAGLTQVAAGGVLQAFPTLTGGTLAGAGQVTGNVTNTSGTVAPGASPGTLTINGNYSQGASGTLGVEIAGATPGTQFDQLSVSGTASLNGTVAIANDPGFTPQLSDSLEIVSANSVSGTVSNLSGNVLFDRTYTDSYDADSAFLGLLSTPPPPPPPPTPTPTPTPAPTPAAAPAASPAVQSIAITQIAALPSPKKCASRRAFKIRLRAPSGEKLVKGTVFVNGKQVKVLEGSRLTSSVSLKGLPKGKITVKIDVVTESGRKFSGKRKYRTCVPKSQSGKGKNKPRV